MSKKKLMIETAITMAAGLLALLGWYLVMLILAVV